MGIVLETKGKIMIKNSAKWEEEDAPESVNSILEYSEEAGGISSEEMEHGKAYVQKFTNNDRNSTQVHIGYYLPDLAKNFESNEEFRQEFFFSIRPSDDGSDIVTVLYRPDPIEISEGGDGYEKKILEIDESEISQLSYDLVDHGFLDIGDVNEYLSSV